MASTVGVEFKEGDKFTFKWGSKYNHTVDIDVYKGEIICDKITVVELEEQKDIFEEADIHNLEHDEEYYKKNKIAI